MKIYIYPMDGTTNPSTCIDITGYLSINQSQQKRSDDAFAITTFKMIIPSNLFPNGLAKYNIAPFTMFELSASNAPAGGAFNERYFGYSKCTKYLRPQDGTTYYIHDVTLVEPISLLETIQIGTKTFTNHDDTYYLTVLTKLIHNNTGFNIYFEETSTLFGTKKHSYVFEKGTTAFEIANEIFTLHNCKMKAVLDMSVSTNAYHILMRITPVDLDSISEINVNEDYLTLSSTEQNFDNYCKYLESEVDNVVDRNTLTKYADLTVRSGDATCTAENCYIELPAKIESAERLEVFTEIDENFNIYVLQDMYDAVNDAYGLTDLTFTEIETAIRSIKDENNQPKYDPDLLLDLMDEIYTKMNDFNEQDYVYHGSIVGYNYVFTGLRRRNNTITSRVEGWFSITDYMLDEDVYMALPTNEQPTYCYYKSGSNKIEGIYKFYKDDWIHTLIGETNTAMLTHCLDKEIIANSNILIGNNEYVRASYTTQNLRTNPLDVKFNVGAHPITNQYVKDIKDETNLFNAASYFKTSRSYGNGANYVDYDIMRKNISISNSFLGTPELTIQLLDYCNLVENSKFTYDSQLWYVKSIIMELSREHIIYTINASTNYNKQADSIGVRTQYQATKIALDNIKERHLYFVNTSNEIELSLESTYFLQCDFYRSEVDQSPIRVLLRASIYSNGGNGITVVASTADNYSAGVKLADNTNGKYVQKDVPYVDENGEMYSIECNLLEADSGIPLATSRKFPEYHPSEYSMSGWSASNGKYVLYKDEHESLVITVYLPNASYED